MADREISRILDLWRQSADPGEQAVLATVIHVQGSSYRLPGARLLLTRDGRRAGAVSGGCLEDDLSRKAWWFTEQGPSVRRYDTTAEGEIAGQFGLGCNGVIYLSLERIARGQPSVLDVLERVRRTRAAATVTHPSVGLPGVPPFVETLLPPVRLLVFGAGDDAIPLTNAVRTSAGRFTSSTADPTTRAKRSSRRQPKSPSDDPATPSPSTLAPSPPS